MTRAPIEHELKTWPEYFQAIVEGRKPFEYRLNDRDFQVGDTLFLREFVPPTDPENLQDIAYYTGRTLRRVVTYILDDRLGPTMKAGFVVMGIAEFAKRFQFSLSAHREAIKRAGLFADLPSGYQCGADAMEQFSMGKLCAVEAILAMIDT